MTLSTDVITKLSSLRAKIKALQKQETELTESIDSKMQHKKLEEFYTKDCPLKLVREEIERASVPWKKAWKSAAKKLYGDRWRSKEKALLKKSMTKVIRIQLEKNDHFKRGKS